MFRDGSSSGIVVTISMSEVEGKGRNVDSWLGRMGSRDSKLAYATALKVTE